MKQTQIYFKEISMDNILKSLDKIKLHFKYSENKIHKLLANIGYYKILHSRNNNENIIKLKIQCSDTFEKIFQHNKQTLTLFIQDLEIRKADTVLSHIPFNHKLLSIHEFCFPLNGKETQLILEFYNDTLQDFYILTKKKQHQ